MEWLLELVLVLLLALTLFHALRLERALGVLQRDRAALEEFVTTFNASTRQAEQGVERLHAAADGAGRQIARQVEAAVGLKDDLHFLVERGERLADRLDGLVRAARTLAPDPGRPEPLAPDPVRHEPLPPPRPDLSRRDLPWLESPGLELPLADPPHERKPALAEDAAQADTPAPRIPADPPGQPRLRSQAERDLLKALRTAR